MRAYQVDKTNADKQFREVRVYSQIRPEVVKPPEPLSIFCSSVSSNLGNRVKIQLGEKPMFAAGKITVRDNPLLNSFFSIDFIGIIAIVMSLLALIFTYDACTKEKEDGTLKLLLSNSLSRHGILLGKVLGVCLTLLPIILFCYILGTILILRSSNVSFSAGDWGRIGLLFFTSLLYFMVFIFIGLLISTRLKSSITSSIVCLFFWVFFVFIVPNLAVYLAQSLRTTQSYDNLQYVLQDLDKECQHKCDEYLGTLEPPDWYMNWNMNRSSDGMLIITGNTKSSMERYRKLHEFTEPLRIEYADKKWLLQKAYLEDLDGQRGLAERISLVSPSEVFRLVCASLCRTDVTSHYRFMDRVRRYREQFIDFYKDRRIFSSFMYFTPQPTETFLTADEIVRIRTGGEFKTFDELKKYFETHPVTFVPLRKVEIPGTIFEEYPYLDLLDVPVFQWRVSEILLDLKQVLMKVAAMVIVSIVLFYLTLLSFLRYDVR
jgi:ABC-type transport system involved in multi-copper enzyme maturation permease subunit